jgi:translation initiation factor 2B subunit (eIF-2B alpha/beta/delta family)
MVTQESNERLRAAAYALRNDRVHGAMELALRAVDLAVELLTSEPSLDVHGVAHALATARPSMAAIVNAIARTLAPFASGGDFEMVRQQAENRKAAWHVDEARLIENTTSHIPKAILTYSHASTTRSVLLALRSHLRQVIIPEGRPVNDGKRLAAILAAAGIPVTVITEAQMGWWVPQVEAVVVGADTVTPAGDVVNHMGTATLALVARAHGVPMYSLTHTLKVAPYDRPEDLGEENDPAEIWADPPAGIAIRNPAFDRTPAERITVITERGVLTDDLRAAVVAEHRAAWRALGLDRADAVSS